MLCEILEPRREIQSETSKAIATEITTSKKKVLLIYLVFLAKISIKSALFLHVAIAVICRHNSNELSYELLDAA